MKILTYPLIGLAFVAGAAHAQQAGDAAAPEAAAPSEAASAAPADHADHAAPAEAASPDEGAASPYTEDEIDSFAKATVKIHAINADAALDAAQKQTQMAAAVKDSGLDPAKYNEMGEAAAADASLMAKVQTAMRRHTQPSQG